jgi:hypothetical protein
MRKLVIGAVAVAIAFVVGATGAPGQAAAAAATWLAERGHVTLVGPVGDAVREAL